MLNLMLRNQAAMIHEIEHSEAVDGQCELCGATLPGKLLKLASMPSVFALIAIGNSDPEDPEPVPLSQLSDKTLYCPMCLSSVNMRRAIFGLLILIVVPLLIVALGEQFG